MSIGTSPARCRCGRPLEFSTMSECVECRAHGGIPIARTAPRSFGTVSYRSPHRLESSAGDGTIAGGWR